MHLSEFQPSPAAFREAAARGNLIPVFAELVADCETPVSAFAKLDDGSPAFLLESAEHIEKRGRYSFVGVRPRAMVTARGTSVTVEENGAPARSESADPLDAIRAIMARYHPAGHDAMPGFFGGAVGYLAYDAVRLFEPTVAAHPNDALKLPDAVFFIAETVLIFDHLTRRLRVVANAHVRGDPDAAYEDARNRIAAILERLGRPSSLPPISCHAGAAEIEPRSNTTPEEYMAMVRTAQEYIRAGDIFQVVPSQRFEADYSGDPLLLYRCLRFVNPSPYMFCMKLGGGLALVGSSPEVHVRAIGGKIEIRPIAGTRPRGATDAEDAAHAASLLADPKERAEHVMLVDLARNDVGRVSEFASVKISDFMTIERYSHVMHIVTNVEGTLREGRDAYDVMRATFPAGTVSGSPKVRAMQIIAELEKSRRGAYAGAVGYFGFDGNHDSCIALRTLVLKGGKAYGQAGAGVVADSVPESEHQECVNKARALFRALALAVHHTEQR